MHSPFLRALIEGTDTSFLNGPLPDGAEGVLLAPGAWQVTPATPPLAELVISCGIHGNETAPIELVDRLVATIRKGQLASRVRLLFIVGNLQAMRVGKRYLQEDMNRLFCGKHASVGDCDEARRVAELEGAVTRFFDTAAQGVPRWHFDLHTAIRGSYYEKFAIYPHTDGRPHSLEAVSLLGDCDVHTLLLHTAPSPTFSYFTSHQFAAQAFTLELGKARPFGENGVVDVSALERTLQKLIGDGSYTAASFQADDYHVFHATRDIIRSSETFKLNVAADILNFTPLEAGYVVGEDGSDRILARAGEHIIFPNPDVKIGLRAGILVAATRPSNIFDDII
ncbi:succinylglutamate desuccinylase [Chitinivorax sp. PXF-14]|uniref:succinylglutamate desuccinylase n=1 Tax=Chitinivorax sp. PXF-14 TaxID=3230488 RepID=UPI003465DA7F